MTPLVGIFGGLLAALLSSVISTKMLVTAQSRQVQASELLQIATRPVAATLARTEIFAPRSPAIYVSAEEFNRACTDINNCQLPLAKVLQPSTSRS
jgi:hypothetical protein